MQRRCPCTTTGSSSNRCPWSSLEKYGTPSPKSTDTRLTQISSTSPSSSACAMTFGLASVTCLSPAISRALAIAGSTPSTNVVSGHRSAARSGDEGSRLLGQISQHLRARLVDVERDGLMCVSTLPIAYLLGCRSHLLCVLDAAARPKGATCRVARRPSARLSPGWRSSASRRDGRSPVSRAWA